MRIILIVSLIVLVSCATNKNTKNVAGQDAEIKKDQVTKEKSVSSKDVSNKTSQKTTTCTLKEEKRVMSIIPYDSRGCKVLYVKGGVSKPVAKAKYDLGLCDKVYNKMQKNLESAGFKCT